VDYLVHAYQFPVGTALRRDCRTAVVDWARRTGWLALEDDYDGEFWFDRQSVGALQGFDPDCVVYLGTASMTLAPGPRLAWMALPPRLTEKALAAKGQIDSCEVFSQLTMAELITSGAYDRHVRAARRRYRDRRDALVTALVSGVHREVAGRGAGVCRLRGSSAAAAAPSSVVRIRRYASWAGDDGVCGASLGRRVDSWSTKRRCTS
jgi:GntR family transcriptional regulator / MocR family aminotransferase